MSAGDVLARIVAHLEAAAIPYMIAGSFASTYHGVPRTTQDIDIVIDPSGASLVALVAALPDTAYYVDLDTALDALRRRSSFNVIDMATGWKVDLIVRHDRAFSVEELQRRQRAEIIGVEVFVATVEDAVIAKLEWAKLSDSDRQLRDVAGMLSVRGAALDLAYVERWVDALGLRQQWRRVNEPDA